MNLPEKLAQELKALHQEMTNNGHLRSREQLRHHYTAFREQFGPDRLQSLDGQALLYTMHAHRYDYRNSLVYWLEFKNDEEFPAIFGSIAGGSALKFGVYQRKEDGVWMTGSPQNQLEISEAQAIDIARKHREQLLKGVTLLEKFLPQEDDTVYQSLQREMDILAPDVSKTAWGHKYFSLLFPDKLDDYHVENYQRFHLIKLLQKPPEGPGRYVCAGRYVAIANELDMPLNHLTTLLNQRNGRPYRYWRIGTRVDTGEGGSRWELMRQENCVAIGWPEIGDLSAISRNQESQEKIRSLLQPLYPTSPPVVGRKAREIFNFVAILVERDLVLAADGAQILGIGRVIGDYFFIPDSDVPHRRPVEWITFDKWSFPQSEGLLTTVKELLNHSQNRIEVERQILLAPPPAHQQEKIQEVAQLRLGGIPGRIQSVLTRKKQVILYGPPGTGKTYWAKQAAQELAAHTSFGRSFVDLTPQQKTQILEGNHQHGPLVRMCTFHPAYGYEDFLEGYRPHMTGQQVGFERRDGIFKKLCDEACHYPNQNFYLIIDEINRGDIPRIFGELLTALERDKRGQAIWLPLSGTPFVVPENVYLVGTMNTADRSIALLDTALRRRFGFIELMPDSTALQGAVIANSIPLGLWLDALNDRILTNIGRDARNLQIGHAYLLENGRPIGDLARFCRVLQDDILPLLEEYCYEDYTTLSRILGKSLVDETNQRIRHELFELNNQDNLISALLEPNPDLPASAQAVASLSDPPEPKNDEEGQNEG